MTCDVIANDKAINMPATMVATWLAEALMNKAGYTATSCGRVGRGGYARFSTFRLVLTDQRTDGPTDKASYRVACPQLKRKRKKEINKR